MNCCHRCTCHSNCCRWEYPYLPTVVIPGRNVDPAVYGGLYNTVGGTITLTEGTTTQLPLPTTLPNRGITYGTQGMIVPDSGIYEVNYSVTGTVADETTLTLSARRNQGNIPSATISEAVPAGANGTLSGSTLTYLNTGDVVDLALTSSATTTVTTQPNTNAIVTLKKVD